MKAFFRFLTAEINGFYLSSFNNFLETYIEYLKPVFAYFKLVQFKLEDEEITDNEMPMYPEDVQGIGYIAGVFPPYISAESNLGSLVFTNESHIPYTERGLFDMDNERFDIIRTAHENYDTDIITQATERRRASFPASESIPLTPSESLYPSSDLYPLGKEDPPILGWIPYGVDVLDEEGNIIPENILPPTPEPDFSTGYYYPYYGDKYLFLSETFFKFAYLEIGIYKKYVECCQRIRKNGESIEELVKVTRLLTEDYIQISGFASLNYARIIYYKLNEASELDNKFKRQAIWLRLIEAKFKQLIPEEAI